MIAGKLNVTVECSPLLGPQLMPAVEGRDGGKKVPKRIVTEEGVFPMETRGQGIPEPQVLIERVRGAADRLPRACLRARAGARDARIASASPACARCTSVDFRLLRRRGPCADGAERRRQVDADQGADRRVSGRRRRACGSTARRSSPTSPLDAQRLGISTVYQEVNLCPNLSVAENIFAGRYPRQGAAQAVAHRLARDAARRARALLAAPEPGHRRHAAALAAIRSRCSRWWRSRARSSVEARC